MFGPSDITCPACFRRQQVLRQRRLDIHRKRKAYFEAKRDAIESGKVSVITLRDDVTGIFYRYDKAGRMIALGCGDNRGA